jgi:tRNA(Phe) wybutosine-synthesizing methylase Tyw3
MLNGTSNISGDENWVMLPELVKECFSHTIKFYMQINEFQNFFTMSNCSHSLGTMGSAAVVDYSSMGTTVGVEHEPVHEVFFREICPQDTQH